MPFFSIFIIFQNDKAGLKDINGFYVKRISSLYVNRKDHIHKSEAYIVPYFPRNHYLIQNLIVKKVTKSAYFKSMYGLSGDDYRIATISKSYQTFKDLILTCLN